MRVEIGGVTFELTPAQVESLCRQLGVSSPESEGLLAAAAVARRLGVSRDFVYEHAEELGGQKLGTGPKAHWRFDPAKISQSAASPADPADEQQAPKTKPKRPRPPGRGSSQLAVRGESPYAR